MKEKQSNPAFPTNFDPSIRKDLQSEYGAFKKEDVLKGTTGISTRMYLAAKAMQGFQANPYWAGVNAGQPFEQEIEACVRLSYKIADELIKQGNE